MRLAFQIAVIMLLAVSTAFADVEDYYATESMTTGLGANDLTDMAWDGNNFWVEGSGTLSMLSGDGFLASDWVSYDDVDGFGRGSISAMWASGDTLVVSWGYSDIYRDELWPYGDGISVSVDHGETWRHVPVVDMFPERADDPQFQDAGAGLTTTIYDIVYENGVLWCSTTAGYLLKTTDLGLTWTQVLPYIPDDPYVNFYIGTGLQYCGDPNGVFSYGNFNHHGQCVDVYGDTLWVGTFRGINLSTDGGATWKSFHWPLDDSGDPEAEQLPGNFVLAVEHKIVAGVTHVWVASQDYIGKGIIAVVHTADNGETWNYALRLDYNSRPYNIAFGTSDAGNPAVSDSTVYVATTAGLMASNDLGATWETLEISEPGGTSWDSSIGVASVMTAGGTLWATSSDGLARSEDGGETWNIFKGITRVKTLDSGNTNIGISAEFDFSVNTYAFPNPFSPSRSHRDYSRTRVQYALENDAVVTVKIYNYSGNVIRVITDEESRTGGRDYQDEWDGTDHAGEVVPNGVYFYTITTDKGDSARGKIMVLD